MSYRITLFLLAPVFFLQNLTAQNVISVKLETQRQRIPMDVILGQNQIQVCGLRPGTTYSVVAVPAMAGEKTRMALTMTDANLEMEAKLVSRPDRPQEGQRGAWEESVNCSQVAVDGSQEGKRRIRRASCCGDLTRARWYREKRRK